MYRRPILPPLVAMFLTLLLATAAQARTDFDGSVLNAGEGQLVLLVSEEPQTFMVNGDTRITVDGQEAALADVMTGHLATVSAEHDGDHWIAKSIAAHAVK